ncbi:protein FAM184B isoform X2 [Ascaphus truei]|uniref:protein FAM184B isoform X2 n=1 Tax=Ascaphus truei TaxID=8439 RepID=UPI003F59BB56
MASGKNHQQGTYSGSKASELHLSQEYTLEMHIKMCKKIAQLTKVIYALNTKVDEYEVNTLALKEAHQDEIDHISTETRETILQYESKVGEEQNLLLRIQKLEEVLEKNNMIKEQTLADVNMSKQQAEERELRTKSEHTEKITALSEEMLTMKTDFEKQLLHLNQEADSLRKVCKSFEKEKSGEKLNEKLNIEVQTLIKEVETLKTENRKLSEEYAQKTSKLHSNYNKERENLRKALQRSVTETLKQWQQKEQEQRKSSQAKETAMQKEAKQLKSDLETKAQNIKELKKKMKERIQDLEMQLRQKSQEVVESKAMLTHAIDELSVAKHRLLQQENEIHNQTEQMESMSSTQKAAVTELAELRSQLFQLQQKTSIKSYTSKKENGDAFNLKQLLKEDTVQKEEIMKQYKEEICKIKRQKDEEKIHLKEQLVKGLEDLAKNHTLEIKAIQSSMETERIQLQKKHQMELEELRKEMDCEINQLKEEKEALCVKLQDSLCKEPKEQMNTEYVECHFKQHESNQMDMQTVKEKSNRPLKAERAPMEMQYTLLLESLKKELSDEHVSCTSHKKHAEELVIELKNLQGIKKQMEESSQNLVKKLNNELDKCQKEMCRLEKENSLLKGSAELLSKETSVLKQEALGVQEKDTQQIRFQDELKKKQKAELESMRQSHQKEIQTMVSDFSSAQAFLQAKIVSLEAELKEIEDKAIQQPEPEDVQLLNCLQDKLTEKDQVIKQLLEVQKCEHVDPMPIHSETHRSRSFSCNPNAKKKFGEAPTRVISVPNLAAYEKTFLNQDLMSKNVMNPIRNSPSLDHSVKLGHHFKQHAQLLDVIRPNRRTHDTISSKAEMKDQDPKRPEWFTKYFSF